MPLDFSNRATLADLIRREHWEKRRSLRALERELGVGNGLVQRWCARHGIRVRTRAEQIAISNALPEVVAKRSGERHWAWGMRRPDSAKRMRERNPMTMAGVPERKAVSMAATFRKKLTPGEEYLLAVFLGRAIAQHPVGRYILDLAFLPERIAVEVDGKNHWERRARDGRRTAFLVGQGWRIVRIDNHNVLRPHHLVAVLKQLIPDLEVAPVPPPKTRGRRVYEYRVLVCDAKDPAGRKV